MWVQSDEYGDDPETDDVALLLYADEPTPPPADTPFLDLEDEFDRVLDRELIATLANRW